MANKLDVVGYNSNGSYEDNLKKLAVVAQDTEAIEAETANKIAALKINNELKYYETIKKDLEDIRKRSLKIEELKSEAQANYFAKNSQELKKLNKLEADLEKKSANLRKKYGTDNLKILKQNITKQNKEEINAYEKQLKEKHALEVKAIKKNSKEINDYLKKEREADARNLTTGNFVNRIKNLGEIYQSGVSSGGVAGGILRATSASINALSGISKNMTSTVDSIASIKSSIDTALQGSTINNTANGSYWAQMQKDITNIAAISPLVRQEDTVKNIQSMIAAGISFNVEQRAFLATISDKIATTFNATDSTLLKLIKLQQADSTAARLGMESAMTAFLNNMYENTEYLRGVADSVRSSLAEAMSLMDATSSVGFEYQVQKWMGSLSSVGMSNEAVQGIASAFGKLAAGDISGLTEGGYGNLLIMAANQAGLSIGEILQSGINDSKTNTLLNAVVNYLIKISNDTADNHVVRQQLANIFGMRGSDLTAASNLSGSLKNISANNLSYNSALERLYSMANSMYKRTSIGELMNNSFSNAKYSLAANIASNPALYAILKAGNLLEDLTGGISLASPFVMGTGVNFNTTVADLMRATALGGSALGLIGNIFAGGAGGGLFGNKMLSALGINKNSISVLTRGAGTHTIESGESTSESAYIGNAAGSEIKNSIISEAHDEGNKQLITAQEENNETKLSTVDNHIVEIANLLKDVISAGHVNVRVEGSFTDNLTNMNSHF